MVTCPAAAWPAARCTRWSRRGPPPSSPAADALHRRHRRPPQGAGALVPDPARSVRAWPRCRPAFIRIVSSMPRPAVMPTSCRSSRRACARKAWRAVIGEVSRLGLTASRRLQLAAEASGVPALVIRRWWTVAEKDLTELPTAAVDAMARRAGPVRGRAGCPASAAPAGRSNSCAAGAPNPVPGFWRPAMRRVVSLYLPTWPTDRIRRRFGEPPRDEAARDRASSRARAALVASACPAAQTVGLHRRNGRRPSAGHGAGSAHHRRRLRTRTRPSLRQLARWAIRYSPVVAPDPPDGLWIDIAGVEHLFGGEEALLEELIDRV